MKKRILNVFKSFLLLMGLVVSSALAQMGNLHGDDREYRIGVHAGNQFRTTFFNDGTWGGNTANTAGMSIVKTQKPGEWPINSGHWYLIDGCTFILSEVADNYDPLSRRFRTTPGNVHHIQSTVKAAPGGGTPGDKDPLTQSWWTFLPLPGFANSNDQIIAMSKGGQQWFNPTLGQGSWPAYWPDIKDPQNPYKIYSADGWAGSWNGYFGRNKFNADEESYFVADDYAKQKFPSFRPDTNDVQRGGLGLRMYVRGFQWAKTAVQDALFIVSDLQNIGTYQHNKVVFGYKIGNNMGQTNGGSDAGDDGGSYSIPDNLCWTWDENGTGASDWGPTPVGISGAALLETPGNSYDGIDNDNDGNPASSNYGMKNKAVGSVMLYTVNGLRTFYAGSGPLIPSDLSMFAPKVLKLDDKIVIIDYKDPRYRRIVTTLRDTLTALGRTATDTLRVTFGGFSYKFWAGDTLREVGDNLFDDNLNGIIDENRGVTNPTTGVTSYLYLDHKYIDYTSSDPTTNGSMNPLIDERRDDGIDNNGNWDPAKDDAGQDGLLGGDVGYIGPDTGERDGLPTPGEVHFDKTDINESDMVGLTAFNLYIWNTADVFGTGKQDDDEGFWKRLAPGSFYAYPTAGNVELLFGSGYFPMPPGDLQRISYSFIVVSGPSGGWTSGGGAATPPSNLLQEKTQVQLAYDQNYNFSKPPDIPTITGAITGDHRVTLFWDTKAESSVDPISGNDFEGYKIYRSTDPGWNDMTPITDAFGTPIWRKPLAQFDLDQTGQENDYKGFATVPYQGGVFFWLGDDTGIRHYWVDTTVVNGTKYYYAVTSYDHGDAAKGIDPAECSKFVAVNSDGTVEKGTNVAVVIPNAPAAGYVPADLDTSKIKPSVSNTASGSISYKIINPELIKDNHTYRITFTNRDTVYTTASVLQNAALIALTTKATRAFTLVDTTAQDTIMSNTGLFAANDEQLSLVNREGFTLSFLNNPGFMWINTNTSANAGWNRSGNFPNYRFEPYTSGNVAKQQVVTIPSGDYKIFFGDVGIDTSVAFGYYVFSSKRYLPAKPVNFTIVNTITGKKVKFGFKEVDSTMGGGIYQGVTASGKTTYPGVYSFDLANRKSDEIIILNPMSDTIPSWSVRFQIDSPTQPDSLIPAPGDFLALPLTHPFLSNDSYTFTTKKVTIDLTQAKSDMNLIRVVPNPYIVTNSWEPRNPYSSGRGTRQLHFTHLPQQCTINIYTMRGQLVKTIYHSSSLHDGSEVWDMLSKDNLDIAYGIYIYHIDAPGIGEKIDKFVVIK